MSAISGIKTVGKFIYAHRAGIALTAGFITGGAALIETARKSTKNTPGILEEHKKNIAEVKRVAKLDERPKEEMTKEEKKYYDKQLLKVYKNTGAKLVKNYALAGGFALTSAACFGYSYKVLRAECIALTSAYTALSEKFEKYRSNIRDTYGDEADFKAMNDIGDGWVEVGKGKSKEKFSTSTHTEDVMFVFDNTWEGFEMRDSGFNIAVVKNNLELIQSKLDNYSVDNFTIEDIVDCFGDTRIGDRKNGLPMDYKVLGYLPGDTIEYEMDHSRAEAHFLDAKGVMAPPITITFKNAHPVLSAARPGDDAAKAMEDAYMGYLYEAKRRSEEAVEMKVLEKNSVVKEEGEIA